ncbi:MULTISPECIES: hypothetical protein [unclassified Luteibacter]|uniref:hypothetical protein n=1 Tax=Luteibacter sp. PvP019 TaxID=3156436 RepID=UPI003399CA89
METQSDLRMYVFEELKAQEVFIPERYLQMLRLTPADRVIEGLSPWAFLPTPERSVAYCSEAFGSAVLPFAQAVGEDLIACFVVTPFKSVDIVLLNPWADDPRERIRARFSTYEDWLEYAEEISRVVTERERLEDES